MVVNKVNWFALILLFLCIVSNYASLCPPLPSPALHVETQCPDNQENCTVLSDALEQLHSTPVLHLGIGTHRLMRYTPVSSLLDIFIVGGGKSEVIVECDIGTGLSFVNMTRLTLCGFTIDGCGLTHESISVIEQQLKQVIMLWFGIPSVVSYGVVLGSCWNVTLSDLLITNTMGMGLLAINVLGDSVLQQVSFTNNIRLTCRSNPPRYPFDVQDTILKQIGGGAYFLYQDELTNMQDKIIPIYNLVVRNCTFSRNAECSYAAITQVNFQQFPSTFGQGLYQVGAGGGLSVFITQQKYNVYTLVENSTFTENDARYGAGAHIGIFAGVDKCTVIFRGCRFERNGAKALGVGDTIQPRSVGGSGLAIFTDMLSPNTVKDLLRIPQHNYSVIVDIRDTHFISNVAGVEGGGLLAYSLFNTPHRTYDSSEPGFYTILLNIKDCTFYNNSAQYGAAAYFQQNVHQGIAGSVLLQASNITFSHSKAGVNVDLRFVQEGQRITSALALVNMYIVIKGKFICSDNEVTGILLQSTQVLAFEGSEVLVERNHGQQGGGVHLTGEGSGIGFYVNTVLSFTNNTASIYGGAVYVSSSITSNDVLRPIDTAVGCFISPFPRLSCFTENCIDSALDNVSISFVGNTAPRGSIVYGSTLETCIWAIQFKDLGISVFQLLYLARSLYGIEFDINPNTSMAVSTPPSDMCVLGPNDTTVLNIFPGQTVNVSIKVFDQFGFTIPATVTSHVSTIYTNSTLGSSGFFFAEEGANRTTLTVGGLEEEEFQVFFTEISTLVSTNLTIHTKSCLQGFTYGNDSHRCKCNDQLISKGVMCDLTT